MDGLNSKIEKHPPGHLNPFEICLLNFVICDFLQKGVSLPTQHFTPKSSNQPLTLDKLSASGIGLDFQR